MEITTFMFKDEEWLVFNFLEPLSKQQFECLQKSLTSIDKNVIVLNQTEGVYVDPNSQ